jgi:hypothetical protein
VRQKLTFETQSFVYLKHVFHSLKTSLIVSKSCTFSILTHKRTSLKINHARKMLCFLFEKVKHQVVAKNTKIRNKLKSLCRCRWWWSLFLLILNKFSMRSTNNYPMREIPLWKMKDKRRTRKWNNYLVAFWRDEMLEIRNSYTFNIQPQKREKYILKI